MINIKEYIIKHELDEMTINILLNSGLIIIWIAIFYFLYVSKLEQEIIKKQANIITYDLVSSIKPFLRTSDINNLKANLRAPDMTDEDNRAAVYNQNIKNSAYNQIIVIFAIIIGLALLISIYFIDSKKSNYITILQLNLIMLVIVALTEFLYAVSLPNNYIIGDPNYVKFKILTTLHDKFINNSNN
jgi:hypothetical protein